MTRTIVLASKAEYDALVSEEKNFILSNQGNVNVGDTVLLQYIEPEVQANEETPHTPPVELEHATLCSFVTTGHPIFKGWQALTLKSKEV